MAVRLEQLINATRERLEVRKSERPLADLEREVAERGEGRPFREGASVADVVQAYERGGAAALSVLTEEDHFGGSLNDLHEARAASSLPILRKDFTLDPYQLYEARAAGADAVLLVVGSLDPDDLARLYEETRARDLDALVEIH